jgi:peroxiredoxin
MKMETGLAVLHLFGKLDPGVDREAAVAAVKAAEADGCQVVTAAMLRSLQTALADAGVAIVDSYVSITEVSEYAAGMPEHLLRARLYPELPPEGLDTFCFYPMSKRREGHANWYATPYEQRHAMMMEHGASGRTFAGQVVQLVTGSTGLDDHEWGVTLFARSPEVVKDVVYTMRFDEGSALYGEFGRFYVGYLTDVDQLL